ncbi:Mevalonate kinase [Coemansia sp. RSA 552]|nr:Mevalonate kinase [Coemansia sp. RSA 552]
MVGIPRETQAPFVVSAPGKVILFGEHAVVYGKQAIAGSLDMRAYALVTPRTDKQVRLFLPDIDVDVSFATAELPQLQREDLAHPGDVESLCAVSVPEGPGHMAVLTFVYLYGCLVRQRSGLTVCVRSLLPVGAGLGSSASFNVALSTALLHVTGRLQDNGASAADRRLINEWAFQGEQVAHGTPSGIDNSVATYGGFLAYTKGSEPSVLRSEQALRVLITNTNVPKSTKALVAGVRVLRDKYPAVIDPVLDSIHGIAHTAAELFQSSGDTETALQDIVRLNHGLLTTLGVSHPSLERIREITAGYGLASKLTGAGGGGCALTLVPRETSDETVGRVAAELTEEGFQCHHAVVGGHGVAVSGAAGSEPVAKWIARMLSAHMSLVPGRTDSDSGADEYGGIVSGFSILPDTAIAKLAPSQAQ